MSTPSQIAIVGCGFTGTSTFFQLVDRYPAKKITIFEASGDFGPGYAYRTDECADYLINNTTDTMCLTPASRRAFLDWLRTQSDLASDLDECGHLPRHVYGRFLHDVFSATRVSAAVKGINVHLVPYEATELYELDDGGVHIGWSGGEIRADAAILTTGRCPDLDDLRSPPDGSAARYLPTQVMTSELDDIPNDATVHILGASLSAYDVINRLFSPDTGCHFERASNGRLKFNPGSNDRHVALCSRSGRLKAMQSQQPRDLHRTVFTEDGLRANAGHHGLALDDVRQMIDEEAAKHGLTLDWETIFDPYSHCDSVEAVTDRAGELLRSGIDAATHEDRKNFLVDLFADSQLEIWHAFAHHVLTAEAERAYRNRLETGALAYAAPCPVPPAERLLALLDAGRLSIIKGVTSTELADDGSGYIVEHDFGSDLARVLVNATGRTLRDVNDARQSPLIRMMADKRLLRRYERDGLPMNGADVDMQTFRLPDTRNVYMANMFLWGPGFFTSSAWMMATIAERIVDELIARGNGRSTATRGF